MGEQTVPVRNIAQVTSPAIVSSAAQGTRETFTKRASDFVAAAPSSTAGDATPTNDPIPKFMVQWTDLSGVTCASPEYFSREDADEHFAELVTDRHTFQARLLEEANGKRVALRAWQASAVPPSVV